MKKTLIALMALAGVASADTIWSFDGDLTTTGSKTINTTYVTTKREVTQKEVTNEGGTTIQEVVSYKREIIDASYVASGLTIGTQIGNYVLTADKNQAIDLTNTSNWLSLNDAYYTNGDGKLQTGKTGGTDFTITAYVKFNDISGEQFLFGTYSQNTQGVTVGIKDGQLDTLVKYKDHYTVKDSITLNEDTWYHLAYSYNSATNTATYYVNGDSIGSVTLHDGFNSSGNGEGAGIGAASQDPVDTAGVYGPQGALNGYIAELKVFNTTLNQQQVLAAANLVPEPATATLSLLALAGLCARRRRA